MTRGPKAEIMDESCFHRVCYTKKDGKVGTGYVQVAESPYDNDEGEGASICVDTDDGRHTLVYDSEITDIEILD